jgi:jouberin
MDIIYELSWSVDERYLMSASADGSCRVWDVHEELINRPKLVRIIPHSAYVYSSQFFPLVYEDERIVATGGYDKVIRTWSLDETRKEPLTVLETMSAINALRFFKDGSKMFTGDASGTIKTYICSIAYQNQKPRLDFQCVSSISLDASYKSPITVMQLHAEEKRMLVQNRRGTTKLLDMRLMRFVAEYENKKTGQCKSVISPCGNYVYIASSKQSFLNIHTIQGKLLGKYPQLLPDAIISSLSIHPFDHMIAASALGSEMPLLVLTKDDTEPAVVTDEVSSMLPANPLSPLAQEMQQIQDILARSPFELADKKPIFMSPTPEPQMRALTGSILNVTGREVSIN